MSIVITIKIVITIFRFPKQIVISDRLFSSQFQEFNSKNKKNVHRQLYREKKIRMSFKNIEAIQIMLPPSIFIFTFSYVLSQFVAEVSVIILKFSFQIINLLALNLIRNRVQHATTKKMLKLLYCQCWYSMHYACIIFYWFNIVVAICECYWIPIGKALGSQFSFFFNREKLECRQTVG